MVDGTWSASDLLIWTVVESGTYLIAACLPLYRPLMRRIWQKLGLKVSNDSQPATAGRSGGSTIHGPFEHNKFKRMADSQTDDSDAVGLVELGAPRPHVPGGQIMVDRRFSVHGAD